VGANPTRVSLHPEVNYQPISLDANFRLIDERWQPRVIAEVNDYQFKIVKINGDFVWHDHKDTDEAFIVIDGELRIDFRDRSVTIGPGELYVVPRGVEHKPFAAKEARVLVIEPRGVVNTGATGGELTVDSGIWV
jgi:mannose-6-phosphate isomerase-like protein (cupin superfamily)